MLIISLERRELARGVGEGFHCCDDDRLICNSHFEYIENMNRREKRVLIIIVSVYHL